MVRTVLTPEKQDLFIHIPKDFIGRQIEILLYPVDEITENDNQKIAKTATFRGKLKLTDEQYNDFQSHIIEIRNEWDRDI